MKALPADHPLRRMFSGVTEHALMTSVGIADPKLVDYISELMARFIHSDAVFRLHSMEGRPLTEVAEMVMEAEDIPQEGRTRREYFRHIGDFALFFTGLFPEDVQRKKSSYCRDSFASYTLQGKRSYLIASSFDDDPYREEAAVLKRLGSDFELCTVGLNRVRKELDELHGDYDGTNLILGK